MIVVSAITAFVLLIVGVLMMLQKIRSTKINLIAVGFVLSVIGIDALAWMLVVSFVSLIWR